MGRIGLCVFCLLKFSVLIVCKQHNDKEWMFKEQHAKNVGKYCGGEKILSPPWFQHCGDERPRRPRRSDASAVGYH